MGPCIFIVGPCICAGEPSFEGNHGTLIWQQILNIPLVGPVFVNTAYLLHDILTMKKGPIRNIIHIYRSEALGMTRHIRNHVIIARFIDTEFFHHIIG